MPILDQLVKEQKEQDLNWTPSKIINRLGKEINNEEVMFWIIIYDSYFVLYKVTCPLEHILLVLEE